MAKNDGRAPEMTWLTPYLTVKDAAVALEFYQRAFGFTKRMAIPDEKGVITHAEVQHNDAVIMFGPEGANGGLAKAPATLGAVSPVALYLYCADVDAQFKRAIESGAHADIAPMDMFWGDRMCKVTDPDGHVWNFATHVGTPAAPPG